jgi:hypothetical protein
MASTFHRSLIFSRSLARRVSRYNCSLIISVFFFPSSYIDIDSSRSKTTVLPLYKYTSYKHNLGLCLLVAWLAYFTSKIPKKYENLAI